MNLCDPALDLCQRAKNGDLDAGSELVALHHERIYAFLRRLSGDQDEAADLTQKAFCKFWTSLSSYREQSSFSTWLHGIAYHVYLDWRRKKKVTDSRPDDWWRECVADGPTPSDSTEDRDLARHLYALVETLDEDTRQTVHIHYYQGLSLSETAEVLHIATSTVKYRLKNALDFLRTHLVEFKPR
jgi:RNA polymerase sigma-70 factor, ECF subfamily